MRSSVLALLAATLAAVASASLLPVSFREVSVEDPIGVFRSASFPVQGCPSRIEHTETVNEDDVPLVIPHSAIFHNKKIACTEGEMTVYLSADETIASISDEESQDFIRDFNKTGEKAIYGVEKAGRKCRGTSFKAGTVVILFTPSETLELNPFSTFPAGARYMIIRDPKKVGICRYTAKLRPPSVAPEPSSTPPPSLPGPEPSPEAKEPSETKEPSGTKEPSEPKEPNPEKPDKGEEVEPESDQTPEITSSVDEEEEDDDGSVCFPADAEVETEDGNVKKISDVQIGDRIKVADGIYSDVYMFTHKDANTVHDFVSLSTTSGDKVSATRGHYLYINGRFAAAMSAKAGDVLELGNGARTTIKHVSIEKKVGLFNPQTIHGDIIVNSIRASTFTRTVEPPTAQALLAPLRMMYDVLGLSASFLDNGSDSIAALLPTGRLSL